MAGIRTVHAVLTSGCNLDCSYCYQNRRRGARMEWSSLRRAADLALRSPEDEVSFIFYGGEPLLEFAHLRRAVEYIEASRRPEQSFHFGLLTNGTLLGEDEVNFLKAHRVRTQLSFDGVDLAQSHRKVGTFGVLDRLLDALRRDHRRWFERDLTLAVTVLPSTVSCLAETLRYFLSKDVWDIVLSPVATDSSEWRVEQIDELDVEFCAMFDASLEHLRRTGRVPLADLRRQQGARQRTLEARGVCGAGSGRAITVDVDGQAFGCIMFAESFQELPTDLGRRLAPMRLGDITSPGLPSRLDAYPEAVDRAEIFGRLEAKYSSYGRCRECEYLGTCGFCPVSIGHQLGNADPHRVPDFQCAFNRVSLKYRALFPAQPHPLEVLRRWSADSNSSDALRAFNDAHARW